MCAPKAIDGEHAKRKQNAPAKVRHIEHITNSGKKLIHQRPFARASAAALLLGFRLSDLVAPRRLSQSSRARFGEAVREMRSGFDNSPLPRPQRRALPS
jgi:hypothetical protein